MAQTASTIGIKIVTDSSGAVKGIQQVGDKLGTLPKDADQAANGLENLDRAAKIERFQALQEVMSGVSEKLIGFGKTAIDASAKWIAIDSQWSQVWGNMEKDADKSINSIADSTHILPNRLKPAMTSIAAFAKTAGFDTKGSLDLASRATLAAADSAAFYDRSLEDTTESLKSYLKGNYENDAALGISSTETTRNAAANKLYGKSFKDLAEDQKQLTLLDMVEEGNKLSGALGQAAREGDGLENVMGNLKQAQEDFARAVGDVIQPLVIAFLKGFSEALANLTKWFNGLSQPVKEFIVAFGAVLAIIPPLLAAFAGIQLVVTTLGVSLGAFLGVFILIPAAVSAAIVIFKNWGDIVGKLPKPLQNVVKGIELMAKGFKAVALADFGTDVLALRTAFTKMFPEAWWDKMVDLAQVFNRTRIAIKSTYEIVKQLVFGIGDVKKYTEAFQNLDEVFGRDFANKVRDTAAAIGDFFRGNETGASGLSKLIGKIDGGTVVFTAFKFAISALFGPIGLLINAFLTLAKFLGEGSILDGIKKIAEGFLNLTSSVGEASTNVGQGVGNMLLGITTAIAEFLPYLFEGAAQIVNGLVQGLAQSMPLWIEALKGLLNIITTVIVELVPVIAENGSKIIMALTQGILIVMPVLIQSFTSIINSLLDELSYAIPSIMQHGTDLIVALAESISQNLPRLIKAGTDVIVSFLNGLTQNLPRIINAGVDLVVAYIRGIASRIGDIVNAAIDLVVTFARAMIARMPEIIDVAVEIVVTLVDGLARNAEKLVGAAINLLATLIDGIANNLWRLERSMKNLVDKIVQFIVQFANDMWEAAIALLEGLADGIRAHKDRVRSALWEVVSALGELAFGDVLWNNGTALISGLWEGMLNKWSQVQEWVGGIADWIADHKGPVPYDKKVLVENGQALMFGLHRGLMDGFKDVMDDVSRMAVQLQDNLDGQLSNDFGVGVSAQMVSTLTTANKQDAMLATQPIAPIAINIEGNVDSDERVNQLARTLETTMEHHWQQNNQFA